MDLSYCIISYSPRNMCGCFDVVEWNIFKYILEQDAPYNSTTTLHIPFYIEKIKHWVLYAIKSK